MNSKYIIIVLGEPYGIFSELIGKFFLKKKKFKKKVILIGNTSLLNKQLKKLGYLVKLNIIKDYKYAKKNIVNIIDVQFNYKKTFSNITNKSNKYIKDSFNKSLEITRKLKNNCVLINGPILKNTFLKKKFSGITEYLSKETNSKNEVMLIYNDKISVSPITTHLPLKKVAKKITKPKICKNILSINNFYKKKLKKKCKFAILGLNPHCETTDNFSEEEKIIIPSIKHLQKLGIFINGPFSADTFFLQKNLNIYDVVIGMYHDQVLTPIKTLYKFKAINITIGLPFLRISPDHGPNLMMLGKNKSDPTSLFYAMNFAEKFD